MRKEQNVAKAGAVLLLSSLIVKLIGALFKIPLSADYALGDLGFGYFSAAYDMYLPFYTLALSGFPVAIARVVADFTAREDTLSLRKNFLLCFKSLSLAGIIGSFLLLAVSYPLVYLTDKSGNSLYSLWAVVPSVLFCCISSVYRGYFEGLKNMVPTAVSSILEALCKLILGLGGAIIVINLTHNPALAAAAAMSGVTLGTVISTLYLGITFKRKNEFSNPLNFSERVCDLKLFKGLCALALPVAVASLSVGITSLIDSVTLRFQLSELIKENPQNVQLLIKDTLYSSQDIKEIPTVIYGIRGKAHTLFNLVPTLTASFGVGAVPIITECYEKKQKGKLNRNVDTAIKLSAFISLPAAAGFLALGEGITELLYGEVSAVLGGKILTVYGVAALFGGLCVPTTSVLQALKRQKAALFNIGLGIAVKLLCNLFLTPIPELNVLGAVIGTALCFAVICVLNFATLVKALGFYPDIKNCLLKPFLSAFLCCLTAFLTYNFIKTDFGTVLAIALGGAVYLLTLWLSKAMTKEEIFDLIK